MSNYTLYDDTSWGSLPSESPVLHGGGCLLTRRWLKHIGNTHKKQKTFRENWLTIFSKPKKVTFPKKNSCDPSCWIPPVPASGLRLPFKRVLRKATRSCTKPERRKPQVDTAPSKAGASRGGGCISGSFDFYSFSSHLKGLFGCSWIASGISFYMFLLMFLDR